jgi:hypothetical protein
MNLNGKDVTLVIGDLAGVENTFACDELQTQIAFINKRKELDPNSPSFMTSADIKKEILTTERNKEQERETRFFGILQPIQQASIRYICS